MKKETVMRLIKQSILPLLGALSASAMSFLIGWYEGSKTTLENDAAFHLVLDVTDYNLLEEGKIDRVKGNLGAAVIGDIDTCDLFKMKESALSAKYKIVEKGRAIAEEQKINSVRSKLNQNKNLLIPRQFGNEGEKEME
jgi:hypothetical protein